MLPLTFLSASSGQPLAKGFTPTGSSNYPRVKKFISTTEFLPINQEGLKKTYDALRKNATAGNVLLKGTLDEPLIDQPRAGKTNTTAASHLLVIDIDGWPVENLPKKLDKKWLAAEAKKIVHALPYPINETSFVVNASASTGMKGNKVGLHIFFLLDQPVTPVNMANWLTLLNRLEPFSPHLELSPSRLAIKWVIDPVVARPAQLVYIAPPIMEGVEDPFRSPADRWALVDQEQPTCDLMNEIRNVIPEQVELFKNQTMKDLRKLLGLPKRTNTYNNLQIGKEKIRVVANPQALQMEFVKATEHFAYWNINNGDSNAYYHPIGNPEVIYNFKDEPPFIFRVANEEMYNWYCETYKKEIRAATRARPFAFRDINTDDHWSVEYSPVENKINHIAKIQKQNLADWFAQAGKVMPDPIPQGEMVFDPSVLDPVQWEPTLRVNLYSATDYITRPPAIMPQARASYGNGFEKLRTVCPYIACVILHICGDSDKEADHFLNWLAWLIQNRDKTQTAWVFSGVPGTGKGILFERVLQPIIGEKYAMKRRIDHAEENFNAFAERALMIVYDEFRLRDSKTDGKLLNKIKDEITASNMTLRAMRQDHRDIKSYSSFIFFSNHLDAMRIEEGDRRFNIATPQRKPLIAVWPKVRSELHKIDDEIGTFAGFLAAYTTDANQVRTTMDNEAKRQMKDRAMYPHEKFCYAVKTGDLTYFYEVLDMDISNDISKSTLITTAQKTLKHWSLAALKKETLPVSAAQLLTFYMLLHEERMSQARLTSLLKRNDILIERKRMSGSPNPVSCTEVFWQVPEEELETANTLAELTNNSENQPVSKSVANLH